MTSSRAGVCLRLRSNSIRRAIGVVVGIAAICMMPGCLSADDGHPASEDLDDLAGGAAGSASGGQGGSPGPNGGAGGTSSAGGRANGPASAGGAAGSSNGGSPPNGAAGGPARSVDCSAAPLFNCGTSTTGTLGCSGGQVCCLFPGCAGTASDGVYTANGAVSRCVAQASAPVPVWDRCPSPAIQLCARDTDCDASFYCDTADYHCAPRS